MFNYQYRKKKKLQEMHSVALAILLVQGFLVSGYILYVLDKLTPEYIRVFNSIPFNTIFSLKGFLLLIIYIILATCTWHFGCIAKRCSYILYNRWYQ